MKRWGLLAAAALLSIGTALAEEEPSRHIRTTISGEAYAVAVDADVYGEEQKAVQAYRVTTLDLGKNPEAHFDLALWFGTDALLMDSGRKIALGRANDVLTPANLDRIYGMDVAAWMRGLYRQWAE